MLTITQKEAGILKTVFRQALDLRRRSQPIVAFWADSRGLHIQVQNQEAAVEYFKEGEYPGCSFFAPFEIFETCQGGRNNPVEVDHNEDTIFLYWTGGAVPQMVELSTAHPPENAYLDPPETMTENPPELLDDLRAAVATTDTQSCRLALACIQFRGERGEIVAANGRELFLCGDVSLPFTEDILVPGLKILASRHVPQNRPVSLGKRDDWFAVRVGPWTFYRRIEKEAAFPDTSHLAIDPNTALTTLHIDQPDDQFVRDNIPHLPSSSCEYDPVTVDLNGSVAIRAAGPECHQVKELVLSRSHYEGEPVQRTVDRRLLHRVVSLGFPTILFFKKGQPLTCRDNRRSYIFMPLLTKPVPPGKDSIRIESSGDSVMVHETLKGKKRSRKALSSGMPPASPSTADEAEVIGSSVKPAEPSAAPATSRQLGYIEVLARQIRGIGVGRVESLCVQIFSKSFVGLDEREAQSLIERLKAVRCGRLNVDMIAADMAV